MDLSRRSLGVTEVFGVVADEVELVCVKLVDDLPFWGEAADPAEETC